MAPPAAPTAIPAMAPLERDFEDDEEEDEEPDESPDEEPEELPAPAVTVVVDTPALPDVVVVPPAFVTVVSPPPAVGTVNAYVYAYVRQSASSVAHASNAVTYPHADSMHADAPVSIASAFEDWQPHAKSLSVHVVSSVMALSMQGLAHAGRLLARRFKCWRRARGRGAGAVVMRGWAASTAFSTTSAGR